MPITHEDDLGTQHPDLAVRNAFDDIYPWALGPSSDEVRAYCRTLVEEVLHTTEALGVVVEACGPFGVEHGSIHDKSDMVDLSETERALLSICFCVACLHALDEFGLDADALADSVRTALSGPVDSVEEALGEDTAARLAQFRTGLSSTLRHDLVESARSVRPDASVTVHASVSPWATDRSPPLVTRATSTTLLQSFRTAGGRDGRARAGRNGTALVGPDTPWRLCAR